MKTITKRDLVMELSDELGVTQRDVFNILQGFIDQVTTHLLPAANCTPTFPGSSAAWKPGPRKEILSNQ